MAPTRPPKPPKPPAFVDEALAGPNPFAKDSKSAKKPPARKANIVKSGNAGSSKPSPLPEPKLLPNGEVAPPPLFPVGFKTPLNLLSERCQKMGWERPSVDPRRLPNGKWTANVTIKRKHPKTKELESVPMRPPPSPSPIAVEKDSAMEAKHYASIFAMYRFSNNLQLKIQLPPVCRDYWSALQDEQRSSPPNKTWLWSLTPFETAAAAPAHPLNPRPPPPTAPKADDSHLASSRAPAPSKMDIAFGSASSSAAGSRPGSQPQTRAPTPKPSLSKWWSEAPEVKMPSALRDLVEETIRSCMSTSSHQHQSSALVDDFAEAPPRPTAAEQAAADELMLSGFRRGHVASALSYLSSLRSQPPQSLSSLDRQLLSQPPRTALLSHLHLHIPEEDLPSEMRASKPADAAVRLATSGGTEGLKRLWTAERIAREVGVPVGVAEQVLAEVGVEGDEGKAVELLVRRLVGWSDDGEAEEGSLSGEALLRRWRDQAGSDLEKIERTELEERREDELVGLEGQFGDRFRRVDGGCEILASSMRGIGRSRKVDEGHGATAHEQVVLRVSFHPASRYPSPSPASLDTDSEDTTLHLPTFYIYSSTLPPYLRLHLTSLLARQFLSEEHGEDWRELAAAGYGGVVGECATWLESHWRYEVENPPDSRLVLRHLLGTRISAPAPREDSGKVEGRKAPARGMGRDKMRGSPQEQEQLRQYWETTKERPGYEEMRRVRMKLPAWSMKDEIVSMIANNRVVIVSGETGSGKTTQVPRFVLEDAILANRGASVNIIVTQPRRVSAIGVASRVGAEMMEDINSATSRSLVGYAIRGERKAGPQCRVLFCTTGVVLSRLSRGGDPDLDGVSHIFIDEVHERSVDSDFLLLELRDILKRNKKIKVVLMSATINQAQFSDYYGGAPCIEIPGFTHPVQDHYLEEILPHLPVSYYPSNKPAKKATQAQLDRMRDSFVARGITNERQLSALESLTRSERLDFSLVGATVAYCLSRSKDVGGDVLVFMTGVFEIKQAVDAIRQAVAATSEKIEVLPLHANLTSQEQTLVFKPVKPGHRKVVVSTNVAETSITIDGIVYVIDCGRVKENQFDPETSITKLVETWTSKASSRQRRGRAGRTRPGECFKLFTHYTEETVMAPHPTPEIMRIPLEALCLQIKAMRADEDVKLFLGKALNPPDVRAIDSAWATLRLLGAIEEEGGTAARLTPLGMHLAMIPVDLRLGKMLVLAAIFRCLDPILTVVALLSSKPFFLNPMDKRDEAKKARSMYYSGRSDLLSDVKAFDACLAARSDGHTALRNFAEDNFISLSTFRDVLQLRNEYLTALSDVGFVPFRAPSSLPALNENVNNENLLKAIIFAGTGRLVKVKLPPATFDKGASGAIERDRESREVKFFEKDGRVFLHPGSLLFTETRFATPFMTYFSKHVTTKPFLRDATEVPLYGVLLFGGKVNVELDKGVTVGTDGWVMMRAWPRIGVLVNSLRRLFDEDLESCIEQPNMGGASPVVDAMLALLERDGGLY